MNKALNTKILTWSAVAGLLVGLYLSSLYSYILFHSLAELFSIVVAFAVFTLAWNLRKYIENNYLIFIGIAFLYIGFLDLLHTLAYKGMGVFPDTGNIPTQLWIATRYLQSLSLAVGFVFLAPGRRVRPFLTMMAFIAVTALLVSSIFVWKIFPACFVDGQGLTPFKKISEYVISSILLLNIALLLHYRDRFEGYVFSMLILSLAMTTLSELAFTFYINVYGFSNLVGHYGKIFAFWFIYKALVETGFVRPFDLVFRELTLKEQAEKEAKQVAEEAKQVAEEAKQVAEEANRAKSAFLANMSHEIRSPLNVILNMADLALAAEPKPKVAEYLTDLRASSRHLLTLINDVLDFSKIEAGRLDLESIDFDLYEWTQSTLRALEYQAKKKGLNFQCIMHPETPRVVRGDPARMRQVLMNLVDNAIKFTEAGEVRVEITPGDVGVSNFDIPCLSENGRAPVLITIRDTGIGIDPGVQSAVFEGFRQADGSITRKYGGTGLGLSICGNLTRLMGGKLWMESRPGAGSTFYALLVFEEGDPARVREHRGVDPGKQYCHITPCRALVAEDNPLNFKVARAMLERLGCDSDHAATGREVLEKLKDSYYNLVLMDVEMPEIGGLEAARLIRSGHAGETCREIPIVAMTAHAMEGFRNQCLEAGMNDYLAKPVDSLELAMVLSRVAPPACSAENEPGQILPERHEEMTPSDVNLNTEKALARMAGDRKLLKLLRQTFLEEISEKRDRLEKAARDGDFSSLAKLAHDLKSSCGMIGADFCQDVAAQLEENARKNPDDRTRPLTESLLRELDRLEIMLETDLAEPIGA